MEEESKEEGDGRKEVRLVNNGRGSTTSKLIDATVMAQSMHTTRLAGSFGRIPPKRIAHTTMSIIAIFVRNVCIE